MANYLRSRTKKATKTGKEKAPLSPAEVTRLIRFLIKDGMKGKAA